MGDYGVFTVIQLRLFVGQTDDNGDTDKAGSGYDPVEERPPHHFTVTQHVQ